MGIWPAVMLQDFFFSTTTKSWLHAKILPKHWLKFLYKNPKLKIIIVLTIILNLILTLMIPVMLYFRNNGWFSFRILLPIVCDVISGFIWNFTQNIPHPGLKSLLCTGKHIFLKVEKNQPLPIFGPSSSEKKKMAMEILCSVCKLYCLVRSYRKKG